MKVRTEPLLGAAMFGIVLQLIYNIFSTVVIYNNFSQALSQFTSPNFDPANPGNFPTISPLVSLLGCLVFLVAGIGTGVLYAVLHNREEKLTGSAVKGGVWAGALSYAIAGFIGGLLATVIIFPLFEQMTAVDPAFAELGSGLIGASIVGIFIGSICTSLVMAIIGAILGAVGGALGGAFVK